MRGKSDLAEGLTLSVECDAHARAAQVKLEELLGPATVVVESGGEWTDPETGKIEPKLHTHYRLKAPAGSKSEQEKLKLARKLAAKIVGGDPSNVPLVHPIRWPGSLHRKGDPKLCHIVSLNPDAEIDLDTALEILRNAARNEGAARRKRQRLRLPLHAGLPRQGDELPGGARGNPGRRERGRRMGQSRRRAATRTRLGAQQAVANSG